MHQDCKNLLWLRIAYQAQLLISYWNFSFPPPFFQILNKKNSKNFPDPRKQIFFHNACITGKILTYDFIILGRITFFDT